MVPMVGLEPTRLAPPPPQDGVSTNSTTSAYRTALLGNYLPAGGLLGPGCCGSAGTSDDGALGTVAGVPAPAGN